MNIVFGTKKNHQINMVEYAGISNKKKKGNELVLPHREACNYFIYP